MSLLLLEKAKHLLRMLAVVALFLSVMNGHLLAVSLGMGFFLVDAVSAAHLRKEQEEHDAFMTELDSYIAAVPRDEASDFELLKQVMEEFERENVPAWRRWMRR